MPRRSHLTSHAFRENSGQKTTGHSSESGYCHVTSSTQRTSASSLETYSNLKKKQMVSVNHVPRSVGHAHRRTDYIRIVHLQFFISALMKTAVEQSKLYVL